MPSPPSSIMVAFAGASVSAPSASRSPPLSSASSGTPASPSAALRGILDCLISRRRATGYAQGGAALLIRPCFPALTPHPPNTRVHQDRPSHVFLLPPPRSGLFSDAVVTTHQTATGFHGFATVTTRCFSSSSCCWRPGELRWHMREYLLCSSI